MHHCGSSCTMHCCSWLVPSCTSSWVHPESSPPDMSMVHAWSHLGAALPHARRVSMHPSREEKPSEVQVAHALIPAPHGHWWSPAPPGDAQSWIATSVGHPRGYLQICVVVRLFSPTIDNTNGASIFCPPFASHTLPLQGCRRMRPPQWGTTAVFHLVRHLRVTEGMGQSTISKMLQLFDIGKQIKKSVLSALATTL